MPLTVNVCGVTVPNPAYLAEVRKEFDRMDLLLDSLMPHINILLPLLDAEDAKALEEYHREWSEEE